MVAKNSIKGAKSKENKRDFEEDINLKQIRTL